MAAVGSVPARGRRHPITAVREAQRLAEAGWSDAEIARMLFRGGFVSQPVGRATIGRWVRAERAKRWRDDMERVHAARAGDRGGRPMGRPEARPEFKLARMRALRVEVGLKDAQIARVMSFDFGDELTDRMVAYALDVGRYPRSAR